MMKILNNDWYHQNTLVETLPDDCVGFVYMVTNLTNNRKYIGKKLAKFAKTKYKMVTLKDGTKKRKKIKSQVESDWKTYYGSSVELSSDVVSLGAENFTREILFYCKSKGALSYVELREQIFREVLLHPDLWYNGIVQAKIHRNHVKELTLP
ncbi:MAG: hypothetical protein HOK52_14865 [Candidatus Marinimicrobia bacterium]|nr:hypothetical protein [Candidatus Neomarinimicrobiota bacterium]